MDVWLFWLLWGFWEWHELFHEWLFIWINLQVSYVLTWISPPASLFSRRYHHNQLSRLMTPLTRYSRSGLFVNFLLKVKGKVLPYLLPSVVPGADAGVQAVSPQMIWSHPLGGRLPLLSARPAVTFPAEERHGPVPNYTDWWQRHMHVSSLPKAVTVKPHMSLTIMLETRNSRMASWSRVSGSA